MRPLTRAPILLLPLLAACAEPAAPPMPLAEPPQTGAPPAPAQTMRNPEAQPWTAADGAALAAAIGRPACAFGSPEGSAPGTGCTAK